MKERYKMQIKHKILGIGIIGIILIVGFSFSLAQQGEKWEEGNTISQAEYDLVDFGKNNILKCQREQQNGKNKWEERKLPREKEYRIVAPFNCLFANQWINETTGETFYDVVRKQYEYSFILGDLEECESEKSQGFCQAKFKKELKEEKDSQIEELQLNLAGWQSLDAPNRNWEGFDAWTFFFTILIILFSSLVSADIISINSGGDGQIVIIPNEIIDGFFFGEIADDESRGGGVPPLEEEEEIIDPETFKERLEKLAKNIGRNIFIYYIIFLIILLCVVIFVYAKRRKKKKKTDKLEKLFNS